MDIINLITFFLLITPFYAVITDFYTGKIKNYFIFPALFLSIILTFFIKGFYFDKNNIVGIIICLFFGYLFYKNNKWGAGDGKYIILLGINSIIIGYLQGFVLDIISYLFLGIFSITLIYNIFFLFFKFDKISKINIKLNYKINILDFFYNIFFIYLSVFFLVYLLGENYNYAIIFLSIIFLFPIINKYSSNVLLKILFIVLGLILFVIKKDFFSLSTIIIFGYLFSLFQSLFDQIFDVIDIKRIKLYDIKQGDILTQNSINFINNKTNICFQITPLQGKEIFDLIFEFKERKLNPEIEIYNGFKMGMIMYIGYFIIIIFALLKILK